MEFIYVIPFLFKTKQQQTITLVYSNIFTYSNSNNFKIIEFVHFFK
jgi:hypothetical protein